MSKRSFTLLETIIASVVLVVAIMSTLAAISSNYQLIRANRETISALNAGNFQIEQWMSNPLAFRDLNNGTVGLVSNFTIEGLNRSKVAANQGTVQIIPSGVAPNIEFFEVIVILRWNGVNGERRLTLHSQRYRTVAEQNAEESAP